MADDLTALERATERLRQADASQLGELAAAAGERAVAVERLCRRNLEADEVERVRAALESGRAIVEQIRSRHAGWQEELERAAQAQQYATELGRAITPARGRIDIAG